MLENNNFNKKNPKKESEEAFKSFSKKSEKELEKLFGDIHSSKGEIYDKLEPELEQAFKNFSKKPEKELKELFKETPRTKKGSSGKPEDDPKQDLKDFSSKSEKELEDTFKDSRSRLKKIVDETPSEKEEREEYKGWDLSKKEIDEITDQAIEEIDENRENWSGKEDHLKDLSNEDIKGFVNEKKEIFKNKTFNETFKEKAEETSQEKNKDEPIEKTLSDEEIAKILASEFEKKPKWQEKMELERKEKKIHESPKIDYKKVVEEVNKEIEEKEAKGIKLTTEEKQKIYFEKTIETQRKYSKETMGRLAKFGEYWKNLDNSKGKRALKAGLSAGLLTATTIAMGNYMDIAPSLSTCGWRLLSRVVGATGLNMALTSNLTKKLLGGKEKTGAEKAESSKTKSFFQKYGKYVALAGGVGASMAISGGVTLPAMLALFGGSGRIGLNALFDKKIKKHQEKMDSLSGKISLEKPEDNFDINIFSQKLESVTEEYNLIVKKLDSLKRWNGLINGALTIGVGLGTMAAYQHPIETESHTMTEAQEKSHLDNESISKEIERKEIPTLRHDEQISELKEKLMDKYNIEEAIVRKGEGIEHSFIRQIEHNSELAKELGFKGNINDTKALHQFAGKEAHIIAIKTGYVDSSGHEVRVAEANKIVYAIEIKNGNILVNEKDVAGNILETHQEGNKFNEKPNIYEKIHSMEKDTLKNNLINEEKIPEKIDHHIEKDSLKNIDDSSLKESIEKVNETILKTGKETTMIDVYRNNIEKLFPGNTVGVWSDVRELRASEVTELTNPGRLAGLTNYLRQLENVTGLKPKSDFMKLYPESVFKYVNRALAEAEKRGLLGKVKL